MDTRTPCLTFSKEYISLRKRTDNVLINARNFKTYDSWNTEMTGVISAWKQIEEHADFLNKSADAYIKENQLSQNP